MSKVRTIEHLPKGGGYVFVDNIRFAAMLALVAIHGLQLFRMINGSYVIVEKTATAVFKFGTIGFFLISGFLMGSRVREGSALAYLGRRLKRVAIPWVLWFLVMVALRLTEMHRDEGLRYHMGPEFFAALKTQMGFALFGTSFWFVPNLFVGLCVLLLFRRYLYSWGLGAVLLSLSFIYAADLYTEWFPSSHTQALFGYIFYLWLGSYLSVHYNALVRWSARVPMTALLASVPLLLLVSWWESEVLLRRHAVDAYSSLRLSNQVYSVVAVLILMKLRRPVWPRFLQVRRETFGIYLVHWVLLIVLLRAMRFSLRGASNSWLETTEWGTLLLWIVAVAAVYGSSVGLTRVLDGWRGTRWMVGAR